MKSVLKMKSVLVFALTVTAPSVVLAQAPDSKTLSSPVADATRAWLQLEAKNLTAAAEEMPADKYSFRPTAQQMTFAHLMAHIGVSNRFMCSGIAGQPAPKDTGVTDKDGKDKPVAEVKASFDYCTSALAKVDDSKRGEEIPLFGRTRANLMMFLTAEFVDHYTMAAIYLRLNGLLPPTAQPKKIESVLAGKELELFRSCIFQLRSRPETRRHSAWISSSVGATNESVSIYCCSVPGSGDACLKFLKDSFALGHRARAILTTQNMLQNAQDI